MPHYCVSFKTLMDTFVPGFSGPMQARPGGRRCRDPWGRDQIRKSGFYCVERNLFIR
ncbi:hypothetical protein SXCC_02786 [Gluconacetobacter sp. SXCC-1]|nr:hypothetical protein SXCC_02786 [Gluconacetobacter sp. SXCC-1]